MIQITDEELAMIWEAPRRNRPAPGLYAAPVAKVVWDGIALTCTLTGRPLDPAAVIISPGLARAAARSQAQSPALPAEPALAALEADYDGQTVCLQGRASEGLFRLRLAACRACQLWDESARAGRGRCNSVRCGCSKRLLWLKAESCPLSKWTETA